ncbi:Protein of unknown function, partial [Cotesia congregata]
SRAAAVADFNTGSRYVCVTYAIEDSGRLSSLCRVAVVPLAVPKAGYNNASAWRTPAGKWGTATGIDGPCLDTIRVLFSCSSTIREYNQERQRRHSRDAKGASEKKCHKRENSDHTTSTHGHRAAAVTPSAPLRTSAKCILWTTTTTTTTITTTISTITTTTYTTAGALLCTAAMNRTKEKGRGKRKRMSTTRGPRDQEQPCGWSGTTEFTLLFYFFAI